MRPRAIQSVPGLNPTATPFDRFSTFVERIAKVSKDEADRTERANKPNAKRKVAARARAVRGKKKFE
jgi:hypothetical protein